MPFDDVEGIAWEGLGEHVDEPGPGVLRAQGVDFGYGAGASGRRVLSQVDFSVREGEVVGLWGSSGCGKSTLAKLLAGHAKPAAGLVTWDGRPLPEKGARPVQIIFQHPERAINPRWRLGKTMREAWDPPQELVEAMGIEDAWLARYPNELSGGEQQRFCIIRALAPTTRILVCDEVSTMLDVVTQAQLWDVLMGQARARGMGMVVITHDGFLAARLCDRVVRMDDLDLAPPMHVHDGLPPHAHTHGLGM